MQYVKWLALFVYGGTSLRIPPLTDDTEMVDDREPAPFDASEVVANAVPKEHEMLVDQNLAWFDTPDELLLRRRHRGPEDVIDADSMQTFPEWKMGIFVHHKTGTVLTHDIFFEVFSKYLQIPIADRVMGWFLGGNFRHELNPVIDEPLLHWRDPRAIDYQAVRKNYPNMRTVHVVRDPVALIISAYNYHSTPGNGDCIPGTWYKNFRNKTVKEGLLLETKMETMHPTFQRRHPLYTPSNIPRMLDVYNLTSKDPLALIVNLNEFGQDYDGTTRRIFSHLLGHSHPQIETLVKRVQKFDVKRWSKEKMERTAHPKRRKWGEASHFHTDVGQAQAIGELEQMFAEGVPEIKELYNYRKAFDMGGSIPSMKLMERAPLT